MEVFFCLASFISPMRSYPYQRGLFTSIEELLKHESSPLDFVVVVQLSIFHQHPCFTSWQSRSPDSPLLLFRGLYGQADWEVQSTQVVAECPSWSAWSYCSTKLGKQTCCLILLLLCAVLAFLSCSALLAQMNTQSISGFLPWDPWEGCKCQERDLWGKAHLGWGIPGVLGWQHALLKLGEDKEDILQRLPYLACPCFCAPRVFQIMTWKM